MALLITPRYYLKVVTSLINKSWNSKDDPPAMQLTFNLREVVFMCLEGTFAILSNMICFVMIGKINERVPPDQRISYLWWGPEVKKKFKHLYPNNKLTLLLNICVALLLACFPLMLWSMGVFRYFGS